MTPIGGYFEWAEGQGSGVPWLDGSIKYQSARAGLTAVLRAGQPTCVWSPHYVCAAVNEALVASGVCVKRYALTSAWSPPRNLSLGQNDWLICVDYFGICGQEIAASLSNYGSSRVIVDAAQSLFYRRQGSETVVYSPRKFIPLPDGGCVVTNVALPKPEPTCDSVSLKRLGPLKLRAAGEIAAGLEGFRQSEHELANCEPAAMSAVTEWMLRQQDPDSLSARRLSNYDNLRSRLQSQGILVRTIADGCVPLVCPIVVKDGASMRRRLIHEKIFVPHYWPDISIPQHDEVGLSLRRDLLALPCDQRYGVTEMNIVADTVKKLRQIDEYSR